MADDLLVARGLVVAYGRPAAMFARRSVAPAVLYGIDIHVGKGETVGIVGEFGSGKTTLGRALLGLVKPVQGNDVQFRAAPKSRALSADHAADRRCRTAAIDHLAWLDAAPIDDETGSRR